MSGEASIPDLRSGYVPVGGLRIYHDAQGDGPPLLLLHGGITTIEGSFGKPASATGAALADRRHRAAGRTGAPPTSTGRLRYEQMVEDTAAVLAALDIADADVFGWSDGGIVALGWRHDIRTLVRRVAIIGAAYTADAEKPEIRASW